MPEQSRGVTEMVEDVLEFCIRRIGTVLVASFLAVFVLTIPQLANWWLQVQILKDVAESGIFERLFFGRASPDEFMQMLAAASPGEGAEQISALLSVTAFLAWLVAAPLLKGALTLLVAGDALGAPVGAGEAWRGAIRRGGWLVLVEIVKSIVLYIVLIFSTVIAAVMGWVLWVTLQGLLGAMGPLGIFLSVFGFVMGTGLIALAPVVILYLLWVFTVPALLFERGSFAAFSRSIALVRSPRPGGFWRSHSIRLTLLLTLAVIVLVVAFLPAFAPWIIWTIRQVRSAASGNIQAIFSFFSVPAPVFVSFAVLFFAIKLVLSPFFPGVIAAYYVDTRASSQAGEKENLAKHLRALCSGEALPEPAAPGGLPPAPASPPPGRWPDGV
ncbi:MAG: hypothetical protein AB1405_15165 [Bdellovibrionota bacterium]